jgi:hypothetical protein
VVWKVDKYVSDIDRRDLDRVVVKFSEPVVVDLAENPLPASTPPYLVFYVYKEVLLVDPNTNAVLRDPLTGAALKDTIVGDPILIGITGFSSTSDKTEFVFYMTGDKDLNSLYLLSLQPELSSLVMDPSGNRPIVNNRMERVAVNDKYGRLVALPDPAKPSRFSPYALPGQFFLEHNDEVRQVMAQTGQSGIILSFKAVIPDSDEVKITGRLKIYDMMGNLVQEAETGENGDILKGILGYAGDVREQYSGSIKDIDVFWNGFNKRGMRVAAGIYRAVLYLEYRRDGHVRFTRKYRATFGVNS